ncbi:hypothetical protein HGRIS_010666 [Hohenbuehelia grisea]|uniref:Peptidase C14 caspase domain-containing protein n=1 Tax=Hohenbuehelia grisea TaxID=104357 RepID=A0ABR3IXW7_9AGAR
MDLSSVSRRRAVLIGIATAKRQTKLLRPHQDVGLVKDLLIKQYHYLESDIVCLTDQEDPQKPPPESLRPTSKNILRAIDKLVKGVRPDDQLFFFYSGHTTQKPNLDGSEEDGKDECKTPVFCEQSGYKNSPFPGILTLTGKIVDDELHRRLIKPLCPGSRLVAFLDSCHSETLLDLPHYHCNRPWTPWVNKRKSSFDVIPVAVWRIGIMYSKAHWRRRKKRNIKQSSLDLAPQPIDPAPVLPSPTQRTPTESVIVSSPIEEFNAFPFGRTDTDCDPPLPPNSSTQRPLKKRSTHLARIKGAFSPSAKVSDPHPAAPHPRCRGLCTPDKAQRELLPHVIAVSACKDSQYAFENDEGGTLTQVLVGILGKTPHPRLGDLIDLTSFKMYKAAVERERSEDFRLYREKHGVTINKLNMYQHPSLASLARLVIDIPTL